VREVAGLLLLAACAVDAPPAVASRLPLRLEFAPPLAAPAVLRWAHECGDVGEIRSGCAGVELTLPPGPVAFELVVAGVRHELVVRVAASLPVVVWDLAPGASDQSDRPSQSTSCSARE